MNVARSLYDILNVSHEAEPVVIEAAYRALMKKYHPDQGVEPGPDMPSASDINRAFAILRDPERRARYDHYEWTRQQNMHLAHYQPPPPPRAPRAFGWSGWIVALLLSGVIVMMARGQPMVIDAGAADAELAGTAEAATRAPTESKSIPSFLRSNAPEREVEAMRRAATISPRASLVEADAGELAAEPTPPPSQPHRRKPRPARRHPEARHSGHDKEFLEREGYIY